MTQSDKGFLSNYIFVLTKYSIWIDQLISHQGEHLEVCAISVKLIRGNT